VTNFCRAVDRFYYTCGDLNIALPKNGPNFTPNEYIEQEPHIFKELDLKKCIE
jgi:hypothetical protein